MFRRATAGDKTNSLNWCILSLINCSRTLRPLFCCTYLFWTVETTFLVSIGFGIHSIFSFKKVGLCWKCIVHQIGFSSYWLLVLSCSLKSYDPLQHKYDENTDWSWYLMQKYTFSDQEVIRRKKYNSCNCYRRMKTCKNKSITSLHYFTHCTKLAQILCKRIFSYLLSLNF